MSTIKIFHTGDIHYSPKHLVGVDRCFKFAVSTAIDEKCDVAVLGGDIFDHRVDLHAPTVAAVLSQVNRLTNAMPVLVLQGTYSHDVPGSLDVFKTIGGKFPVFVADQISQVALCISKYVDGNYEFVRSRGWCFEQSEWDAILPTRKVIFSCLPAINKGAIAAIVGAEKAAEAVGDHVYELLKAWAPMNLAARAAGIPVIGVSHGTVNGCKTEQGVVMAGLDHEYSAGALFSAECSAFMLNHIHQFQQWEKDGRCAGYSGSLERLHYGEVNPKGFIIWEVNADTSRPRFIETPAKRLVEIDFPGTPDMEKLAAAALDAAGAHVRIRYIVDEEFRSSIDKNAIALLFAGAAECKIEGRINPIQRTRSQGITRMALADRLTTWCEVTETAPAPLVERLAVLEYKEPEKIVTEIVGCIE